MTDNERQESISALRQLLAMCDFVDQYGDSIDADPYFNAVETAIESLNETRWIPVSERLPERDEIVLVSYKTTDMVHMCKYLDDGSENPWWSYNDDCLAWNNVILAWMPLPPVYQGE